MSCRRILITGGSRGIGRAMVEHFTRAGDRVAFTYLHSESQARALAEQTGAVALRADAACETDILTAAADAVCVLGGIDVLVNNAGVGHVGLLTDMSLDAYEHLMAVNLTSAFLYSREVLHHMIRQKRGCIINVSSMWGIMGASCEVAYSASKAGLIGMTKALAKEVGPSGIRVNAIAPGVIDTDMNAHLSVQDKEVLAEQTPLGRVATPEEIARVCAFLASDDAAFMTGAVLDVSGGFAIQ